MPVKSRGYATTKSGITATDDLIYQVKENEVVTITSVTVQMAVGSASDQIEVWWGRSYGEANTMMFFSPGAVGSYGLTLHPNVKVLPGEKIVFTTAMIDAASWCTYSITYDVETLYESPLMVAHPATAKAGFLDNLSRGF